MSTKWPVIPPQPKLPLTPSSRMRFFTMSATAREVPPEPVWKEKPSRSRPAASITSQA